MFKKLCFRLTLALLCCMHLPCNGQTTQDGRSADTQRSNSSATPAKPWSDLQREAATAFALLLSKTVYLEVGYPRDPLRKGIEGTALVHISYGADGEVAQVKIEQSTGNAELDQAATFGVEQGGKKLRPPEALNGVKFTIAIPVTFTISPDTTPSGGNAFTELSPQYVAPTMQPPDQSVESAQSSTRVLDFKKTPSSALEQYASRLRDAIPPVPIPAGSPPSTDRDQYVDLIVEFNVRGRLDSVIVDRSSGNKRFDRAAIDAVKKAGKDLTMPEALQYDPPAFRVRVYAAQDNALSER